jgi:hypothetical protein
MAIRLEDMDDRGRTTARPGQQRVRLDYSFLVIDVIVASVIGAVIGLLAAVGVGS